MAQFTTVAKLDDIQVGKLAKFDVAGTWVAIANVSGTFYGLATSVPTWGARWLRVISRTPQ